MVPRPLAPAQAMRSRTCAHVFELCRQWGRLKKRAGDEQGLVGKNERSPFLSRIPLAADSACCPLAFSIILTVREPGTDNLL